MSIATIIIDMQNDFFKHSRLHANKQKLTDSINDLVRFSRKEKIPVIWARNEFKEDLSDAFLVMKKRGIGNVIKGTDGSRLLPALQKEDSDFEIVKKRYSAFHKTDLCSLLQELGVKTLIFAGVNTHACVRTTVIDAYQNDFEIIMAVDCVDSYDEEHHNISLRYLTDAMSVPMTNPELKSAFGR
jgi:nicotinamidase-related amidase